MIALVTSRSPLADRVLTCLGQWVGAGLVEPFTWLPLVDDEPHSYRVVSGGIEDTSLHASFPEGEGRVIVLWTLEEGAGDHDPYFDHVDACRTRLHRVLRRHEGRDPAEVTLLAIGPGAEVGEPAFDRVRNLVYVAPEDRSHPGGADHLEEEPERLASVVSVTVASIGGLWAGLEPADPHPIDVIVTDALEGPVEAEGTAARAVRSYCRVVDGGHLLDHVALGVLRRNGSWPHPPGPEVHTLEWTDALASYLAEEFLFKHRGVFGRLILEVPELPPLGLLEAFLFWVKNVLTFLRDLPAKIVESVEEKVYERLRLWIEDLPGGAEDEGRRVRTWLERKLAGRPIRDEDEGSNPPPLPPPAGAVQEAWNDLVMLVTGLVDGGPLPGPREGDAKRKFAHIGNLVSGKERWLVDDPDDLVLAPAETPVLPLALGGGRVGPADPRATRQLQEALAREVERPATSEEVPPPEPGDPAALGSPQPPPLVGAVASDDLAEGARVALSALRDWERIASRSLLWQIAARLEQQIREAAAATAERGDDDEGVDVLREGPPALAAGEPPSSGSLKRSESIDAPALPLEVEPRLGRRLLLSYLASTVLMAILSVLAIRAWQWWSPVAVAVLIVAWASYIVGAGMRATWRALRQQRSNVLDQLPALFEEMQAEQDRRDVVRLDDRYDDLMEWAQVLGWLVHDPWVDAAETDAEIDVPVDPAFLPACLQVATGVTEKAGFDNLVVRAGASVFGVGWLKSLYDELAADAGRAYARSKGVTENAGLPLPTTTVGARNPGSVRGRLLASLDDREDVPKRQEAMMESLRELVGRESFDDMFPWVAAIPAGGSARVSDLPPVSAWREDPDDLEDLAAAARPSIVRVVHETGGGTGFVVEGGLIVTNDHCVGVDDSVQIQFDDGRWARAELIERANTDIAVLKASVAPEGGLRLANWSDVKQGQRLFSLGFPQSLLGDPTLSWGIVAATERQQENETFGVIRVLQHDARSFAGSSGSPLMNLDREVIGVHFASNRKDGLAYMGSAVPVDELAALLERCYAKLGISPGQPGPGTSTGDEPPLPEVGDQPLVSIEAFLDPDKIAHTVGEEAFVPGIDQWLPVAINSGTHTSVAAAAPAYGRPLRRGIAAVAVSTPFEASSLPGFVPAQTDDEVDHDGGGVGPTPINRPRRLA